MTSLADAGSRFKGIWENLPKPIKFMMEHTPNLFAITKYMMTPKGKATGGPVQRNTPYMVGENGPEMFVPSGSGSIRTNRQTMGGGGTTIINLNGIVDADSARKSIERVLQNSGKRLGAVNLTGSAL
jgi:hypothetical protein